MVVAESVLNVVPRAQHPMEPVFGFLSDGKSQFGLYSKAVL